MNNERMYSEISFLFQVNVALHIRKDPADPLISRCCNVEGKKWARELGPDVTQEQLQNLAGEYFPVALAHRFRAVQPAALRTDLSAFASWLTRTFATSADGSDAIVLYGVSKSSDTTDEMMLKAITQFRAFDDVRSPLVTAKPPNQRNVSLAGLTTDVSQLVVTYFPSDSAFAFSATCRSYFCAAGRRSYIQETLHRPVVRTAALCMEVRTVLHKRTTRCPLTARLLSEDHLNRIMLQGFFAYYTKWYNEVCCCPDSGTLYIEWVASIIQREEAIASAFPSRWGKQFLPAIVREALLGSFLTYNPVTRGVQ
jgi:hypothetical protein